MDELVDVDDEVDVVTFDISIIDVVELVVAQLADVVVDLMLVIALFIEPGI